MKSFKKILSKIFYKIYLYKLNWKQLIFNLKYLKCKNHFKKTFLKVNFKFKNYYKYFNSFYKLSVRINYLF
jgi:hypothetical protein